ncbi:MAG: nuclear transport factor 2 family protein [Longimicrobiales bacterium]|mgnify:FL=1|jgi:hypothetical protein|nr:nuclear transport factor 2 family protein [Longimicrobiales bacterium]|tara:strand:+ start:501 stop:938 length:438 start_codon:yes stop_codon:yes gene_type:complete
MKKLCLLLFLAISAGVPSQIDGQEDRSSIEKTIRIYFDSMHESSRAKVDLAFHPSAKIVGVNPGAFAEMSREDFGDLVASVQPSPKEQGVPERLEILSIEIAGMTAVARVRDDYRGRTFLDSLSLIKTGDRWVIYNKLYHIENEY